MKVLGFCFLVVFGVSDIFRKELEMDIVALALSKLLLWSEFWVSKAKITLFLVRAAKAEALKFHDSNNYRYVMEQMYLINLLDEAQTIDENDGVHDFFL